MLSHERMMLAVVTVTLVLQGSRLSEADRMGSLQPNRDEDLALHPAIWSRCKEKSIGYRLPTNFLSAHHRKSIIPGDQRIAEHHQL